MRKFWIVLGLLFSITIESGLGFYHTSGKNIVDTNGNTVFLKGYGLGGWLVPEGYMLHFPGYGSPTSIRNQIVDVIGESGADEFFQLYRQNYVTEKDIARIAGWGFNSIRLPLHYEFFSPIDQPGVFIETGFIFIDSLLNWCKRNGMVVILDMHCAPGGQNSGNISDSDGEAKLWTILANQTRLIEIWKKIAERYANEEDIVGYDLLNEPVMPIGYSNTDLRNLYISLRNAVREVDNNHILFIEGSRYATDFTSLTPRFDVNMAYSFHKYWSETTISTIQAYLNIRDNQNIPLWMGESGENSNPWFYAMVQQYNTLNLSWCWWAHKKFESTSSPLSAKLPTSFQQLVDYWNGQGTKPSTVFAKSILLEMAGNLAIEKCAYQPDVIASLTDDEFGIKPKPFKSHTTPGIISAVDYDLGTQSIAYSDNDYQNTDWANFQQWNSGGSYRNDGVDIEPKSGSYNEYIVGWINSGEWLIYTTNVLYDGNYKFAFRVSSPNNGTKLKLLVDNQNLTGDMTVPNTGGWQNWQDIQTIALPLTKGVHQIKIEIVSGGFNFAHIQINPTQNGVFEEIDEDEYIFIGKNYPNPFNESTMIPIYMGAKSHIDLKVYDLQGHLIRTLVNRTCLPGLYTFKWDGQDESGCTVGSGVFAYQLNIGSKERSWLVSHLK
ncbi:MAG: glycoside hydrolase family 5 [Candidatus Marinimicrobia bacterium CG08_land_8_20_14_0_20_45_22]|nr:MAG: glycoside hydrolase family 5 [Candidatus Marinimicrobia bacterium CG08_land_8_20_14_0_20_45_22]